MTTSVISSKYFLKDIKCEDEEFIKIEKIINENETIKNIRRMIGFQMLDISQGIPNLVKINSRFIYL